MYVGGHKATETAADEYFHPCRLFLSLSQIFESYIESQNSRDLSQVVPDRSGDRYAESTRDTGRVEACHAHFSRLHRIYEPLPV